MPELHDLHAKTWSPSVCLSVLLCPPVAHQMAVHCVVTSCNVKQQYEAVSQMSASHIPSLSGILVPLADCAWLPVNGLVLHIVRRGDMDEVLNVSCEDATLL